MIDSDRIADDVMKRIWAHMAPAIKAELLNMYNAGYRARMAHEAQDKAAQFGPVAAGPIEAGCVVPSSIDHLRLDPAKESG